MEGERKTRRKPSYAITFNSRLAVAAGVGAICPETGSLALDFDQFVDFAGGDEKTGH